MKLTQPKSSLFERVLTMDHQKIGDYIDDSLGDMGRLARQRSGQFAPKDAVSAECLAPQGVQRNAGKTSM
ncbi:MAG: hypothetical protein K8F27_01470 [Sulfuricellaceae bacterium]|nr:hypothetical protein [Sulfuricellaceae bacterium]